ncbi:hypothetical protein [Nocardia sp. NPDC004260]
MITTLTAGRDTLGHDTAALTPGMLGLNAPYPIIVWAAAELRRWLLRRKNQPHRHHEPT